MTQRMAVKFHCLCTGVFWFVFTFGLSTPLDASNEGTRFILSMFRQGSTAEESVLLIHNPHSKEVNVSARHNLTTTINGDEWTIASTEVARIHIPPAFGLDNASQFANTGFELVSTSPIKVNMINTIQPLTKESTGVFPYVELGLRYSILTRCRTVHTYSKVHIVSSAVKTYVQVKLPGEKHTHILTLDGKSFYGGDEINEDLGEYSVLQLTSTNSLSGTTVLSSDIVSVFAGCDFSYTEYSKSQNTDHFYHNFEHIMDDTRLGRSFDYVSVEECNVTVVAPFGNTTIAISVNDSCEVHSLVNEEELHEMYFPPGSVITAYSNNPILVSVDAGREFYTLLTPQEQGISKTSFCGHEHMPVKFLIYGIDACAQHFSLNSHLMELDVDIFKHTCYEDNKRCFFTSRTYVTTLPCYTVLNNCGIFSGIVQIDTGKLGGGMKEESLGNAMLIIPPSCTTYMYAYQTNNCTDVEVFCAIETTTISSSPTDRSNMLSCENGGYKYTFTSGEQQCFWISSVHTKSATDAADNCGNNQGSLALILDERMSVHIANLIMLKRLEADWFYVGYKLEKQKIRRLTDNTVQTWAYWAPGNPTTDDDALIVHIVNNIVNWYTAMNTGGIVTKYLALCMSKRTTTTPDTTSTTMSPVTTTTTMSPVTTTTTISPPNMPLVTTTTTMSPVTTTTTMSPVTTTTTMSPVTTTTTMSPVTTTTTTIRIDTPPSNATKGAACNCACTYNGVVNLTAEVLDEMNKMKKELQVDKATLSSTIRRKTSALDPRPSSRYVGGTLAIVFTTMSFGGILLLDFPFYIELVQRMAAFFKRTVQLLN